MDSSEPNENKPQSTKHKTTRARRARRFVFRCTACGERIEANVSEVGELKNCPACSEASEVPRKGVGLNVGPSFERVLQPIPEGKSETPPARKEEPVSANVSAPAMAVAPVEGRNGIFSMLLAVILAVILGFGSMVGYYGLVLAPSGAEGPPPPTEGEMVSNLRVVLNQWRVVEMNREQIEKDLMPTLAIMETRPSMADQAEIVRGAISSRKASIEEGVGNILEVLHTLTMNRRMWPELIDGVVESEKNVAHQNSELAKASKLSLLQEMLQSLPEESGSDHEFLTLFVQEMFD